MAPMCPRRAHAEPAASSRAHRWATPTGHGMGSGGPARGSAHAVLLFRNLPLMLLNCEQLGLMVYDEAHYAVCARMMLDAGSWIKSRAGGSS